MACTCYQQLREIDELFQKYGIEYFAIGGTLIGAMRSQVIHRLAMKHQRQI